MIDLHCHILPGLDDGARDLQDSLAMARQAQDDGIETVCATPHIRSDHDVDIDGLVARVAVVQRALVEHDVGVQVLPGGELAQTEADRLTNQQLRSLTLGGGGRWLLVEPAAGPLGVDLERLMRRLAQRGFDTIVAHPERHAGGDFRERLGQLAGCGCLIQWTAEFLAAADDLVLQLAREGFVHLLGSDAHSSLAGRPVRLAAGFARLASVCTAEQVAWTVDRAPLAIVRGESVKQRP